MKKANILVFPCGAENGLNIINSLKYNIHFDVYGATTKNDHSEYVLDKNHLSVDNYNIKSKSFFKKFNDILKKFNIDYIFPTHDEIILFLIENQDKIISKVIASPVDTCRIAFGKLDTYEKLKGSFYLPKSYSKDDKITFPVFIKPNHGAGGKGTQLINNIEEFKAVKNISNYLISEYLPGDELTIDCFTNKNSELIFVGPRTRERITTGVSFRSKNIDCNDEIMNIAKDINDKIKFRGLWFFQLKKDNNNTFKLMEISVRCAGTMDLYRQLGVNFCALTIFDFMGYDVSIIKNSFNIQLDRFYKSCYKTDIEYDNIYLDFDDTLIINGKVNSVIMQLIYQWLNNNKKIYLITKHSTNIYDDLEKYSISKEIFKKIIEVPLDDKKVNYIDTKENSIFIDNYFFERDEVFKKLNIPVFDVDALECLIKYDEL